MILSAYRLTLRQRLRCSTGKRRWCWAAAGPPSRCRPCCEQLGRGTLPSFPAAVADDYDHLDRHADAQIIVNTTPVGMYPR